jgi:ATP-dependent DNA ligase
MTSSKPKQKTALRRKVKATFIEIMDCLPVTAPPEGPEWTYEIKLDGYRLEALKIAGKVTLFSRRRNVLNGKFGYIADALASLPDDTVLDGEIVAMDADGKSDFNLLQNFRSAELKIHYYAFDILMHQGTSLLLKPLSERRTLL